MQAVTCCPKAADWLLPAVSAELATPMHEFPAQSSHECRDCLAELDVTTANGQVGSATQHPGMQSSEASCKRRNIRITFPFT